MLVLKLSLVALSMVSATLAARHFGHRAGGLIAGFPLIMAPLIGLLLIDLPGSRVAEILWTTLANFTACVGFLVAMGVFVLVIGAALMLIVRSGVPGSVDVVATALAGPTATATQ